MFVILQLLVLLTVLLQGALFQTSTLDPELYVRKPNLSLNHVFDSLNDTDVNRCCFQCNLNSNCEAVNFYPTESVCELNDKNPNDYLPFISVTNNTDSDVLFRVKKPCDSGWYPFDRHCYYFVNNAMTWTDSQDNCNSMDADLVEITTIEENTYIDGMSGNLGIFDNKWIGLNDLLVEGSFVWPSGEAFVYQNFKTGEPDNFMGMENCAVARPDSLWSDKNCVITFPSVCEKTRL